MLIAIVPQLDLIGFVLLNTLSDCNVLLIEN
jgi:hypothetical protein